MVESSSPDSHSLNTFWTGIFVIFILSHSCAAEEGDSSSEPVSSWFDNLGISISYNLGYNIEESDLPLFNRYKMRVTWDQLLEQKYLLHIDAESAYDFPSHDIRSINSGQLFQTSSEIDEFYLQTNFGPLSIKAGKQIVVWGKADGAVVTDVMSPRDFSEQFFAEVDIARLGQYMLTLDYYTGSSQLSVILTPDARTSRFSSLGYAGSGSGSNSGNLSGRGSPKPDTYFSNLETGVRWNSTVDSLDYAVMIAEVFEDNPIIQSLSSGETEIIFPRFQMIGGGFNLITDNLLWKGEIAYKKNRLFNNENGLSATKHDSVDMAIGFDYNANIYNLTLELTSQYIDKWDERILGLDRINSLIFATLNKPILNDTATLQYTASYQFQTHLQTHQFRYAHNLNDQVSISLQSNIMTSDSDDELLNFLTNSDIISANVEINF